MKIDLIFLSFIPPFSPIFPLSSSLTNLPNDLFYILISTHIQTGISDTRFCPKNWKPPIQHIVLLTLFWQKVLRVPQSTETKIKWQIAFPNADLKILLLEFFFLISLNSATWIKRAQAANHKSRGKENRGSASHQWIGIAPNFSDAQMEAVTLESSCLQNDLEGVRDTVCEVQSWCGHRENIHCTVQPDTSSTFLLSREEVFQMIKGFLTNRCIWLPKTLGT